MDDPTRRRALRLPALGMPAVLLAVLVACGGGGGAPSPTPTALRSALYPVDWTPATTDGEGRFLHDVGYAGYRGGAAPLPEAGGWTVVDAVAAHGADATGASDATAAVQAAIDAAEALGEAVVFLPAGLYRIDGLLTLTASRVVLRGAGPAASRLWFTREGAMSDQAHLTVGALPAVGAETLLALDAPARQRDVRVADASGLAVGDDVALGFVITQAFVDEHGMDGTWGPFNGTWQPFERREVTAIDLGVTPHRVTLDVPLRQDVLLRDGASLRAETGYLEEVGIEHLGVATAVGWEAAWSNERTHAIALRGVKDGWVRDVASFVSPGAPASGAGAGAHLQNGGLLTVQCKRITIADCRLEQAQHRGGGGCGYLFELRQSNEILTRDAIALSGRHNFIQNWGFGCSGCVWLRCHSAGGLALVAKEFPTIGQLGTSEFHHSLATANAIDACTTDDGWAAVNRGTYSSGAGHSASENVFWRLQGAGVLRSQQFGWGYVIGTSAGLDVTTGPGASGAAGTAPPDWVEAAGEAHRLEPPSLYIDQHLRRRGTLPEAALGGS